MLKWVKRWALLAVGVPVAAWALEQAGDALEQRRGRSAASKGLRQAAGSVRQLRGGRRGRRR